MSVFVDLENNKNKRMDKLFKNVTVNNYRHYKDNLKDFDKDLKILNYLQLVDEIIFDANSGDVVGINILAKQIISDDLNKEETEIIKSYFKK